jgi:hypothetical protein
MIRFSCKCGHPFELPDDAAGGDVQCPDCGLLVGVPFMSDKARLAEDGTYALDPPPIPLEEDRLSSLAYVYAKAKIDAEGNEIDLRNDPNDPIDASEFRRAEEAVHANKPRYDPETGELITAIPVAGEGEEKRIDPATVPFAKPVITYAARDTLRTKSAGHVLMDLFQPINCVVMFFVFGIHVVIAFFIIMVAVGFWLVAFLGFMVVLALLAHYGNVIDEIGTEGRDELPRPLRDLRFIEDIWTPLLGVGGGLLLCYAPAAIALVKIKSDAAALAAGLPLALAGTFALPAVVLTLITSGTFSNLRPDRVLGVIRACGGRYFVVALLFIVSIVPYLWAMIGIEIDGLRLANNPPDIPNWVSHPLLITPLLVVAMFLMHLFCWHVGLLYRAHHEDFPWVGRFHVRDIEAPVLRKRPRYLQPLGRSPVQPLPPIGVENPSDRME